MNASIADMATIAESLMQFDTPYLRVSTRASGSDEHHHLLEPGALIEALARHDEPRVREALIPLFLRHPEYHRYVPEIAKYLDPQASLTLRHFYTATVYLQHLWRTALSLYLGEFTDLPDYYGATEFGLSSPQHHYGEAGLRELAALFEEKTGYNWLAAYESAMERFLAQQSLKFHGQG